MPTVTFSSPCLPRAIAVLIKDKEAESVLALAKAHHIPLPHSCGKGECGVCMIDVLTLSGKLLGSRLTELEKTRLSAMGKITPDEVKRAEANDIAPRYRLACQYIPRYEDVLVKFDGTPRAA